MGAQITAVSILILGKKIGAWIVVGDIALWVALVFTVLSMIVYFWQNRSALQEQGDKG